MSDMAFSMSAEAANWIIDKLEAAENRAQFPGLIPGLYFFFDEQSRGENGRLVEWCREPFFDICWSRQEDVAAGNYVETQVHNRKLFSPPDTLERLNGKQLTLETVQVGFPTPSDKTRKILRAMP